MMFGYIRYNGSFANTIKMSIMSPVVSSLSTTIKLDAPIKTRALRIFITAKNETDIGIAEIYVH